MQNSSSVIIKPSIKPGKYDFIIQGLITKDKNGYELKTKNGKSYQKLRIVLLDNENNSTVYKAIFGKEDLKEVIFGVGDPDMMRLYDSKPEDFDLQSLIGEEGRLLLGYKNNYPNIECFLKQKSSIVSERKEKKESAESFKQELDEADNVPF